jgi:hypothetical protein
VEKALEVFGKDKSRKDGLYYYCKDCDAKKKKELRGRYKARETIVIPEFKNCPGCNTKKSSSAFCKSNGNPDGLHGHCKECMHARWRKQKYGLSPEQFNAMLEAQNGACAICCTTIPGGRGDWHVDHKHGTDLIRGLLHCGCNLGVGYFEDNIGAINKAIEYLNSPATGILYQKPWGKIGVPVKIREQVLASQNGLCKICSADLHDRRVCIDHDHTTSMVRGALCINCNSGLGKFNDSVELLQRTIAYLIKSERVSC